MESKSGRPRYTGVSVTHTPAAHSPVPIEIIELRGERVHDALSRSAMPAAWDCLYAQCPWSTVFQSSAFARVWYSTYSEVYEPLILTASAGAGGHELIGLLALAIDRTSGHLVQVGSPQAEYGAWLSLPGHDQAFMREALRTLWRTFPSGKIRFLF